MKRILTSIFAWLFALTSHAQIQTYLNRAPGQSDPSITTPVHFKLTFSEMALGFDAADISFDGSTVDGDLVATVTGGPTFYDIYVTGMIPTGILKMTIREGAATGSDPFNIATTAGATISVVINAASPTVTINQAANQTDPTKYESISFDVNFSVPVRGFDASDISLAGSTAGGAVIASVSNNFVVVRGMTSSGVIKVSIRAGAAVSVEGQTSLASTSTDNSVSFEWTPPPTVTINQLASQPDTTSEITTKFQAVFSVPVIEFDASDIFLTGSTTKGTTQKEVSGGPEIFEVTIYNGFTASGNIVVSIPAGAAKSAYTGSKSLASTSTDNVVYYDMPPPSVHIGSIGPDPTNKTTITFFAAFNQDVTGFNAADISFAGSTAGGNLKATVTRGTSPRNYDIVVSGMTSAGDVVVSVPAGAATNREGKLNNASIPMPSAMDNVVHYTGPEPGIPTVTINQSVNQADPTSVSPVKFTAIFSEDVTGFNPSDLLFTGSTVSGNLTGSITPINNREYEIRVSGMTSSGNLVVSVRAGAGYNIINQYNVASTSTDNKVTYNLPDPVVVSIGDVTVYESEGVAVLTISISQTTKQQVTVEYSTADGTAVSGKASRDYESVSGKAAIQPGQLSTTVSIRILNDNISEPNETFYVNLKNFTNCIPGDVTARVTIQDGGKSISGKRTAALGSKSLSEEEVSSRFDLKASPNPGNGEFSFEIVSLDNAPAEVRVVNSAGHVIENRIFHDKIFRMGSEWRAGMYIVDVVQGVNRKTIKLIKY